MSIYYLFIYKTITFYENCCGKCFSSVVHCHSYENISITHLKFVSVWLTQAEGSPIIGFKSKFNFKETFNYTA